MTPRGQSKWRAHRDRGWWVTPAHSLASMILTAFQAAYMPHREKEAPKAEFLTQLQQKNWQDL